MFGLAVLYAAVVKLLDPGGTNYATAAANAGSGFWFGFWGGVALSHPAAFTATIATLELALALSLLLGLLRRPLYLLGMGLGLFLWAVPEGFAGLGATPSLSASAGLLYFAGLLLLSTLDATFGPDPLTIDLRLIRRWPRWARFSEFVGPTRAIDPPLQMLALAPYLPVQRPASPPSAGPRDAETPHQTRWLRSR